MRIRCSKSQLRIDLNTLEIRIKTQKIRIYNTKGWPMLDMISTKGDREQNEN